MNGVGSGRLGLAWTTSAAANWRRAGSEGSGENIRGISGQGPAGQQEQWNCSGPSPFCLRFASMAVAPASAAAWGRRCSGGERRGGVGEGAAKRE